MTGINPAWASLVCTAVAIGGTILVVLASLERFMGRPIPRLKYSRPVRQQRVFFFVPMFMIVVLIGSLAMLLPMRVCSHCPAPYAYQQFGVINVFLVSSRGIAGGVGFLVF